MTEVSIVIPTMNRTEDLKKAIFSILAQTKLPKEVIVVDDSDNDKTRELIDSIGRDSSDRKTVMMYQRGKGGERKSISSARNIGMARATGNLILFIDDDVILDKEYIEEILEFHARHPDAAGVQGFIENAEGFKNRRELLSNVLNTIFFLFHKEKDRCRVLPSGHITYPLTLNGVIKCEWLSGTNSSYKTKVIKDFRWDESLKGWSRFEDVDLSCRILKHYPNSLFMTPKARIIHLYSPAARRNAKHLIHIMSNYHAYFFYKNVERRLLNRIIFVWSLFGQSVVTLFFLYKRESRLDILKFLISAYLHTLNHMKEVRAGNFSFLGSS